MAESAETIPPALVAKQAAVADWLNYWVQSNYDVPVRIAWDLGGARAVGKILLARVRRHLHGR